MLFLIRTTSKVFSKATVFKALGPLLHTNLPVKIES